MGEVTNTKLQLALSAMKKTRVMWDCLTLGGKEGLTLRGDIKTGTWLTKGIWPWGALVYRAEGSALGRCKTPGATVRPRRPCKTQGATLAREN